MSTAPQANAGESIDQIRQEIFDALHALLKCACAAKDNHENSEDERQVARDLYDATQDQLDALDRAKFENNTIDLQACGNDLQKGIDDLENLKDKINRIAKGMKEMTSIISGIDTVLSWLRRIVM